MKLQELFKTKESWCKEAEAYTRDGKICNSDSKDAVSLCLVSGIMLCYSRESKKYEQILKKIIKKLKLLKLPCPEYFSKVVYFENAVMEWNDEPGRKFSHVKNLITELDI